MDFATKLKCYRHMLNLTQTNIADAMGVDRSTYAYYETGKTLPTSEGIRFLSALFGVSPSTLLNEKPVEPPKPKMPMMFHDSAPEILYGKKDERKIDMSFPDLTEDEKELLVRYRAMKAAESHIDFSPDRKGEIIRKFLSQNYHNK